MAHINPEIFNTRNGNIKQKLNLALFDHTERIRIGAGAFGEVFSTKYAGTPVAVKKMKDIGTKPLEDEISVLTLISHPNIVSLIAFDEQQIVMSLADGSFKSENMSMKELAIVGLDCMRGLFYMHMHGDYGSTRGNCFIHLDLKPDNILVYRKEENGRNTGPIYRAVLGDVGLSNRCALHKRRGNTTGGTPGFMPFDDQVRSPYDDIAALAVSILDAPQPKITFIDEKGEEQEAATVHLKWVTSKNMVVDDNTGEYIEKMKTDGHTDFAKILDYMLKARTNLNRERDLDCSLFMNALINGFEKLVKQYSRPQQNTPPQHRTPPFFVDEMEL